MVDQLQAAERAIYDLLNGNISAPVFEHVAPNTPAPFVHIGEMTDQPMDTKGDEDSIIGAQINAIVEGEERRPLLDLLGEIRLRLDGEVVERDGWELHFEWVKRTVTQAPDMAQTYLGLATFQITALSQ